MALISAAQLADLPAPPTFPDHADTRSDRALRPVERRLPRPVVAAKSHRNPLWRSVIERALAGAASAIAVGEGPVVDGWIAAAPSGTQIVTVSPAEGVLSTIDRLLSRDRHGEIAAIMIAIPGHDAVAATAIVRGLAAVIARAFHDALILVDWEGSEDSLLADFSEADVVVLEASDWAPGPEGPRVVVMNEALAP